MEVARSWTKKDEEDYFWNKRKSVVFVSVFSFSFFFLVGVYAQGGGVVSGDKSTVRAATCCRRPPPWDDVLVSARTRATNPPWPENRSDSSVFPVSRLFLFLARSAGGRADGRVKLYVLFTPSEHHQARRSQLRQRPLQINLDFADPVEIFARVPPRPTLSSRCTAVSTRYETTTCALTTRRDPAGGSLSRTRVNARALEIKRRRTPRPKFNSTENILSGAPYDRYHPDDRPPRSIGKVHPRFNGCFERPTGHENGSSRR